MRLFRVLACCLLPSLVAAQPVQILHRFSGAESVGIPYGALIQVPDGSLYGNANGGIYKIAPGGAVSIVATHDGLGRGALVRGADGALYGTTSNNGAELRGTVLRFDPATGQLRVLHEFREGRDPVGDLVEVAGWLYGVTLGGPDEATPSTIFRTNRGTGATETLQRIAGANGPLSLGPDGLLYGTTFSTIYRMDPASPTGGVVTVHQSSTAAGETLWGRLALASNGLFYGTISSSSTAEAGAVFSLDPVTSAFTVVYALNPSNGVDGMFPRQVVVGLDGHLYGTTLKDHTFLAGPNFNPASPPTLFRLRRLGGNAVAYDTLRTLDPETFGLDYPHVTLLPASDGFVYGTTTARGPSSTGLVYRFDPLAAGPPSNPLQFSVVHTFSAPPTFPSAPTPAPDGFLYGTVGNRGYRMSRATGDVTLVGTLPGSGSPLIVGPDGLLYGTTYSQDDAAGTLQSRIVRIDPATGQASVVTELLGPLVPAVTYSTGGLVRTPAGTIYGVRRAPGDAYVFRLDPATNTTTDVAHLGTSTISELSDPMVAADGRLYLTAVAVVTGRGGFPLSYPASLLRVNPAAASVEPVAALGDSFHASNPVQGTDGLIYVGAGNGIVSVDPASGAVLPVCEVTRSGFAQRLTAAPDGTIHSVTTFSTPPRHVRCNPQTHAVDAQVLPVTGLALAGLAAIDGLLYGASQDCLFRLASSVALPPLDSDGDGLPNTWETAWGLDPFDAAADGGADGDPDHDGRTNAEELAAGANPRGFVTRYFAEGATGPFFQTQIDLGNPTGRPANVQLRFLTDTGTTVTHDLTMLPHSHVLVTPATLPGLAHANFSTIVDADGQIAVDRTMTWNASGYGSHLETGVLAPSTTWYFAEGSTSGQFSLFYLLQNPQTMAVTATVRFLRPAGQPPIERVYTLPPGSRTTIAVDDQGPELASTDVSAVITASAAIVAERAMYFSRPDQPFAAGHESAGVTATALEWFLAEGATGDFFDLFVLLSNPNASDATVEVEYLLAGGGTLAKSYTVPANARVTIWVDDEQIPSGSGQKPLANAALSTRVRSLNNVPIVVERTMWWPGPAVTPNFWYEAHNSPGATATARRWRMGGGEFGGLSNATTYVLVANPGTVAGKARVTLLFDDGNTIAHDYDLPPKSRTNVPVASDFFLTDERRFAMTVESIGLAAVPIVVERATYTSAGGVTWAAGSDALASSWP